MRKLLLYNIDYSSQFKKKEHDNLEKMKYHTIVNLIAYGLIFGTNNVAMNKFQLNSDHLKV